MKPIYTPGLNHVMIDIETLDTRPNSPILSIAAVPFALSAQEEIDMFFNLGQYDVPLEYHEFIELPRKIENNSTFRFHIEKQTGAIENCLKNGQPLKDVLGRLHRVMTMWAPEAEEFFVWGWGYGFDMGILSETYLTNPDSWWKDKTWTWPDGVTDYRTKSLHKEVTASSGGLTFIGGGTITSINSDGLTPGAILSVNDDGQAVWSSPQEDFTISTVGQTWPLPYWLKKYSRILDARSIYFGHGKTYADMPVRKGQHHDALDDTKHQILTMQKLFTGDEECSED